jgi:hypothetical protein
MARTITKRQKKKAKEKSKDGQLARTKKGRMIVPLMVSKKLHEKYMKSNTYGYNL